MTWLHSVAVQTGEDESVACHCKVGGVIREAGFIARIAHTSEVQLRECRVSASSSSARQDCRDMIERFDSVRGRNMA